MFIIYAHVNRRNQKGYVGYTKFSIDERWAQHCADARRGSTFAFHKAIRKYGEDAFDHIVLESGIDNEATAGEREIFWVRERKTTIAENGYNMTYGGLSRLTVWSDEMKEYHRQRTAEGTRHAFQNPETKKRHKDAVKAANNRPENRERNSKAQKIAQNRPDVKKKISESLKKTWSDPSLPALVKRSKPVQQIDIASGRVIATFKSTHEAARKTGVLQSNISQVARGKSRTASGFFWRYVGDVVQGHEEDLCFPPERCHRREL